MNANQEPKPIREVGESSFEAEVLRSEVPVLVAFGAPWSVPCQRLESVLEEVMPACAGRVKVVKVNADDHPGLGLWYEVRSIPTLLYFLDGALRFRTVGTVSKEAILTQLRLLVRRDTRDLNAGNDHEHPGTDASLAPPH